MSLFETLVEGKTFDSYEDVLKIIKQVEEQDNIYLRVDKSQTITSFNNRKDVSDSYSECENEILIKYLLQCSTKLDEKWRYFRFSYIFPHAEKYKLRPPTGEQPAQNVMACGYNAEVKFQFQSRTNKFKITLSVLKLEDHPISAEHKKTSARKK